jgi:hypothetical protein
MDEVVNHQISASDLAWPMQKEHGDRQYSELGSAPYELDDEEVLEGEPDHIAALLPNHSLNSSSGIHTHHRDQFYQPSVACQKRADPRVIDAIKAIIAGRLKSIRQESSVQYSCGPAFQKCYCDQ